MPNIIKILRSYATLIRPTGKTEGEPYVNFADRQFGVWDAASPIDLIAVRFFSTQSTYAIGQFVIEAGNLYRCIAATGPGPFVAASWSGVGAGEYLPLAGGVMTGPIDFSDGAGRWRIQSGRVGGVLSFSSLLGGVTEPLMTLGPYEAQVRGRLMVQSNTDTVLMMLSAAGYASTIHGGKATGAPRWIVSLGDKTPETGGDSGSDFAIARYGDVPAAGPLSIPFRIERATGRTFVSGMAVHGVGATPFVGAIPPGNSELILNKAPGGANDIVGAQNGSTRWTVTAGNSAPEAGGNQGSDFSISRWDDTGRHIGPAIKIARQTGVVEFDQPPMVGGKPLGGDFLPLAGGAMTGPIDFGDWRVQSGPLGNVFSMGLVAAGVFTPHLSFTETSSAFNGYITLTPFRGQDISISFYGTDGRNNTIIGTKGASARWRMNIGDDTPDVGVDVGSDFSIERWFASGATAAGTPLKIERATGKTTLEVMPSIPGGFDKDVLTTDGAGGLTWSGSLQQQIDLLATGLVFAGHIDVLTDAAVFTAATGLAPGVLPVAAPTNLGLYLVVSEGGVSLPGNIPPDTYDVGDWLASDGATWTRLPLGQSRSIAPSVALAPVINGWANVQDALEGIQVEKIGRAGGSMDGALMLTQPPVGIWDAVRKDYVDNLTLDAGVY